MSSWSPRPSRNSSRVSEPSKLSRLTRLSLLEPTQREVGSRPIRWSALVLPLVALGLVIGVREVARVEKVLAAEGTRAARVIVYELQPGQELRVPIEPGTDVFRVVVHAVRRGPLTAQPHVARLVFTAKGEKGSRTDDLVLPAPGTTTRANAEDRSLTVGDPVAASVDVHGIGVGELTLSLAAIEGADGALIRVYRRDALSRPDVLKRKDRLEGSREDRLARRAGEVDWSDLDEGEQLTLLGARWRRVAALRDANHLVTHAIALAPAPPRKVANDADPAMSTVDIRADERFATVAKGKTTLRARADGDPEALVVATLRAEDGSIVTQQAKGELSIEVPEGKELGVEIGRSTPGPLSLRASDPTKVEPSGHAVLWRTTPKRPAQITAGASPLVLRVGARRSSPRGSNDVLPIALDATVVSADGTPLTALLRANRTRSVYDRYDVHEPESAPSTSAVFNILIPARGSATLTPAEGVLDLSLSELDPAAQPRPVRSYPEGGAPEAVTKVGDVDWGGFVPRRPSNVAAFEPEGRLVLRTPHRFVGVPVPIPKNPSFRVKRPDSYEAIVIDKRLFDPTTVSYEIDLPAGEALVLPIRLFAKEPMDIVARVDGGDPDRKMMGAVERVTVPRKISVNVTDAPLEVKSIVVLGDDLPPGTHVLTFTPPPGKKAWVHLPWTVKPRLPGTPPPDPHWVEGDLDD